MKTAKKFINVFLYCFPVIVVLICAFAYFRNNTVSDFSAALQGVVENATSILKVDALYNVFNDLYGYINPDVAAGAYLSFAFAFTSYLLTVELVSIGVDVIMFLPRYLKNWLEK